MKIYAASLIIFILGAGVMLSGCVQQPAATPAPVMATAMPTVSAAISPTPGMVILATPTPAPIVAPDQRVKITTTEQAIEGTEVALEGFFDKPGNGVKYAWEFGDGGTTEGRLTARHIYYNPGNYTVKFTVTAGGETLENSVVLPVANFKPVPSDFAVTHANGAQQITWKVFHPTGPGSHIISSLVEYGFQFDNGTIAWSTACTTEGEPYACAWNTNAIGTFPMRLTVTDGTDTVVQDEAPLVVTPVPSPTV